MQLLLAIVSGAALAAAHGLVTSPETRHPGDATASVCSQTMVDFYNTDNTSYPEHLFRIHPEAELLADGYKPDLCNLWLCKGFQFEDNVHQVKEYKAGDVIDMEVFIRIPHVGYANVSVVDIASNSVIAEPLIEWPEGYADRALFPNLPKNQTSFSVTVPDLEDKCTTAGECVSEIRFCHVKYLLDSWTETPQVIQWYWFGQGQTYESCIDFKVPAAPSNATAHPRRI